MQVFIDYLVELNWLAVLIAAFIAFTSSAIWYGKSVMGSKWQKSIGLKDSQIKKANMAGAMTYSFLGFIVVSVAMGLLVNVLVLTTVLQGVLFGTMVAVGLMGASKLAQTKFELRPLTYWYITLGADIIALSIIGAVLAAWK
jgi:hypothetical protein